ncbi:3-oxoacyl-reductase [Podospora conica]|nr:3-oxoacyl-reductase [Schizothecium conicum]
MSSELKGKVAIVTGASRGLGAEMALELASRGAAVMLTYTSPSSTPLVNDLLTRISHLPSNPPATACKVDLSHPDSPLAVLSALDAWLGPTSHINILVNNAATELVKPLSALTAADYSTVYDLNVRGPLLLTAALLPRLSPAGGNRIINIGSVGARCGFARLSLYCSSKAALEGLTRCWAAELGGDGTTVNQVNPGPVQTAMLENIPREIVDVQRARTPIQSRVGTTGEIARIVAWLAGGDSAWVSGQVISASGGLEMY